MKRWHFGVSVAVGTLVLAGFQQARHSAASGDATVLQAPETCVGTLDGALAPQLIPDSYVWGEFWALVRSATDGSASARQRLTKELEVDDPALQVLSDAHERAVRARTEAGASVPTHARDIRLEARDELVRALPPPQYDRIERWVDGRRSQAVFSFGKIGTPTPPDATGTSKCRVSISGHEYPQFIPEWYAWEMYFRTHATIANDNRAESGLLTPAYLKTLQRHHLPIRGEEIELVVSIASAAVQRLAELAKAPAAEADWLNRERALLVLRARAELVRKLPASSWLAVEKDVDSIRSGTVFDFPTK